VFESNCHGNRRDKVTLRTTCIKNVKFKMIKTRSGCQYVAYCRILILQRKPKVGCTNPQLGRISARGRGLDIGGLEISLCVLVAIAGVANQSETKSHISYCVTAKRHIISCTLYMGTHEEHNISLPHIHTFG